MDLRVTFTEPDGNIRIIDAEGVRDMADALDAAIDHVLNTRFEPWPLERVQAATKTVTSPQKDSIDA